MRQCDRAALAGEIAVRDAAACCAPCILVRFWWRRLRLDGSGMDLSRQRGLAWGPCNGRCQWALPLFVGRWSLPAGPCLLGVGWLLDSNRHRLHTAISGPTSLRSTARCLATPSMVRMMQCLGCPWVAIVPLSVTGTLTGARQQPSKFIPCLKILLS